MTENYTIEQAMHDLNNIDADIRSKAVEYLGKQEHAPAVPQLVDIYPLADSGTRFMIVKALGRIGDAEALPVMFDALREDDPWVRAAAAGALIAVGKPAIDGLTHSLRSNDKNVRRAAAKALGKIGVDDEVAVRVLASSLEDEDSAVRRFAAEALGRLGDGVVVPELAEVLNDQNPRTRIAAFRALASLKTPEAAAAMRKWARDQ